VFDGALEDLVERIRPDKRIVLRFSRAVDAADLKDLGTVVRHDAGESVLDVHRDALKAVVAAALARLPVRDMTVENPPLEEVMSELFARNRKQREGA
jgi:ABC-2 type transport system ATP-binding protein